MVYAAMGLLISIIARSSKASLIWSLAIGLILMPRFFVMLVEGAGKIFGWTGEMVNNVSLIAPGVMMHEGDNYCGKNFGYKNASFRNT